MFMAFKKYGVSDPYDFDEEDQKPPWEMDLDPTQVAQKLKPTRLAAPSKIFPWLCAALILITNVEAFCALFKSPIEELKIN